MPLPDGFTIPTPNIPAPPANPIVIPQPPVTETVEKPALSNKELALLVGVPVVTLCVAGGLYYYYSQSSDDDGKETEVDGAPVAVVTPLENSTENTQEDTRV